MSWRMAYDLVIPGEAVPQGRPRFGHGRTYDPPKSRKYKEYVRRLARRDMPPDALRRPLTCPVRLTCVIYRAVPKSWSRRKRIGCILCPYTPKAQKDADMKRWPKYVELYKLAFQRMIDKRKADGLPCDAWETGEDVMNWWTNRKKKTDDTQEISLFGLRLHESDT